MIESSTRVEEVAGAIRIRRWERRAWEGLALLRRRQLTTRRAELVEAGPEWVRPVEPVWREEVERRVVEVEVEVRRRAHKHRELASLLRRPPAVEHREVERRAAEQALAFRSQQHHKLRGLKHQVHVLPLREHQDPAEYQVGSSRFRATQEAAAGAAMGVVRTDQDDMYVEDDKR